VRVAVWFDIDRGGIGLEGNVVVMRACGWKAVRCLEDCGVFLE
jgi:hypothetical protein